MKQIKITKRYFIIPNKFTKESNGYIRDLTMLMLHKKTYGRPVDMSEEDLDLLIGEYERRFKQ